FKIRNHAYKFFSSYIHSIDLYLVHLDFFFFSSRRRHTRWPRDWSSDVCSSDLRGAQSLGERARPDEAHLSPLGVPPPLQLVSVRSEERRVGKECRCW